MPGTLTSRLSATSETISLQPGPAYELWQLIRTLSSQVWKDFYVVFVSAVEAAEGGALELSDCQKLMARIYGERDAARGAEKTLLWMLSEAGEVADAYVKNSKNIGPELADLLAWMLSTCNVLGIDIQKEFLSRYSAGCPRCGQIPCICPVL